MLVDCGLYQGTDHEVWLNHQPFEFDPKKIKYLLLTHAHIDHCGLIGKLVREGFKGKVYCTNATARVAEEMLLDGAGFSDSEYTKEDVRRIQWSPIDYSASEIAEQRRDFKWGKIFTLAPGLTLSPWRSSHVLGACGFSINWNDQGDKSTYADRSIFFSGDIGCQSSQNCYLPMMKKNHAPPPYTDFLVMESTYGSRVREDQYKSSENRIRALEQVIIDTKERGGTLVIPTFAFHRTQEILTDLFTIGLRWRNSCKGDLQCYLESPLSNRLNKVYGEELPRLLSSTRPQNLDRQYLRDDLTETTGIHPKNIGNLFDNLSNGKVATSGKLKVTPSDGGDKGNTQPRKKKTVTPMEILKEFDVVVVSGGMC
ncbi:MBL fold metallo-hydrolase, partial [Oleiphilus sp. HI0079]|uniref:MBL fold metallo-hydrolase n=1 Tax=Oleiphilus sp. HI0079 TaxID=1822254 RepID=UPI0021008D5D